eukprot:6517407-Pyramimonas_sp.AAC.1
MSCSRQGRRPFGEDCNAAEPSQYIQYVYTLNLLRYTYLKMYGHKWMLVKNGKNGTNHPTSPGPSRLRDCRSFRRQNLVWHSSSSKSTAACERGGAPEIMHHSVH